MNITILLFTDTLRLSLKVFISVDIKLWIFLLVHITLHGMIGGLLKHVPEAICRITFVY